MRTKIYGNTSKRNVTVMLALGLIGITYSIITQQLAIGFSLAMLPFAFIILTFFLNNPYYIFIGIFTLNYFLNAIMRYTYATGLSMSIDIMLLLAIVFTLINDVITNDIEWKRSRNLSVLLALVWAIYTFLEVANPNGIFEAWFRSRFFIYYPVMAALIASVLITTKKQVRTIFILYAVFTFISIIKQFMQKYIGFDAAEQAFLDAGSKSTHILPGITRYFSIFTDAGNYGANMGATTLIFGLAAYYFKSMGWRVFFGIVSILSLLAMFATGTRGAIAVPLAGLALFTILSKNTVTFTLTSIMGVAIYAFFTFTTIGQSNTAIRRMRTAFHREKDASYQLRLMNQRKLAVYLADKPFGAGLGLSGGEAAKWIPKYHVLRTANDSTYVKVWVEAGVVGLWIFLIYLFGSIAIASYVIMFRMKGDDKEFKFILIALLCGNFGLCIAAYGNAFLTQFPTGIIVYSTLAICVLGRKIEKTNNIENKNEALWKKL